MECWVHVLIPFLRAIGKSKSLLVSRLGLTSPLPVMVSEIGACAGIVDIFILEYTLKLGALGLLCSVLSE